MPFVRVQFRTQNRYALLLELLWRMSPYRDRFWKGIMRKQLLRSAAGAIAVGGKRCRVRPAAGLRR